ncbi:MAG TPA: nucleoside-diphosphate sugar epimerase/dehydratase [Vicinamibacterales bacterium]
MTFVPLLQALAVGAGVMTLVWLADRLVRRPPARPGNGTHLPAPSIAQGNGLGLDGLALAAADLFAIGLALLGAFILRLDWFFARSPELTAAFHFALFGALIVKPPVFVILGLYRRYWRYVGVRDLLVILLAISAGTVGLAMVVVFGVLSGTVPAFPRSILAIDWLLTLTTVGGLRLCVRAASERPASRTVARASHSPRRVLVVGAGDTGALVVREMRRNPQLGLQPQAFLDDHPAKHGKRIHEVPVAGSIADLETVVAAEEIDEVVIALPTAEGGVIRRVVDACQRAGVPSRAVPGLFELLDGGVSVSRLREIDIADLLRRAPVRARPGAGVYLRDQVVLITGAGGSIGFELCRQVARAGAREVVLVGHGENSIFDSMNRLRDAHPAVPVHGVIADVRHAERMREVLARYRPAVVFHAAAHKHVPLMEAQPGEAVANNVLGTRSLMEAAIETGVQRFVLISTDKAVAPSSVMGATKRVAELLVRDAARTHEVAFAVVRFGNVLGSRGSVVPLFKQQIEKGGPVTVTHPEMTRFFMTIPEAVYLVVKAGGLAVGGELFVLNMGEPVRIVDLTRDLIRLSGFTGDEIPIVYTGLRPGEKLHEALWEPGAICEPAGDDDVLRVHEQAQVLSGALLRERVDELIAAAECSDTAAIHALLQEIVPTYAPAGRQAPSVPSFARK